MAEPTSPPAIAALPSEKRRRSLGLAFKYALLAMTIVAVAVGSTVAVGGWRAATLADRAVRSSLREVKGVWEGFLAERGTSLQGTIRTLADEPQTRALLAESVTPETVQDWCQDKVSAVAASFVAVLDPDGALVARSDKPVEDVAGMSVAHARFVKEAMAGAPSWALVREGEHVVLVAAAPVTSGAGESARMDGVVYAGYPLDAKVAQRIAGLSRTDITIVCIFERAGRGLTTSISGSSHVGDAGPDLAALEASPGALETLSSSRAPVGPLDLRPGGEHVIGIALPLTTGDGSVIGALMASRALAEELATFTAIRRSQILVGAAALALLLPVTFLFGRSIARPILALAASAREVEEGNLEVKLPTDRGDELGELAHSFERMVGELRDKAALEKLVSHLGVSADDVARISAGEVPDTAPATAPRPLPASAAKIEAGMVLGGRYRIEQLLGQGGIGAVWRARDRELDSVVALKVLHNDTFLADPSLANKLKEEIRLERRISHRNVLRTYDFGELDGIRFISMEYVNGPTLRALLRRKTPLALGISLPLARQICRGLQAAHDAGVIHRDVKPANIIVAADGIVRIMDFGIAFSKDQRDTMREKGLVVGTPEYMSPEQIDGLPVDTRTDVYALGVVLYEMFTGIRPFRAPTVEETLKKNLTSSPPPLLEVRPDAPPVLGIVVAQAMAKDPDSRFQSVSEVRRALATLR